MTVGKTDLMTVLAELRKNTLEDEMLISQSGQEATNERLLITAVILLDNVEEAITAKIPQEEINFAVMGAASMLVQYLVKNGTGAPKSVNVNQTGASLN